MKEVFLGFLCCPSPSFSYIYFYKSLSFIPFERATIVSLLQDLGVAAADLAQRLHAAIQTGQPEKGRAGMAGGLASVACILVGAETGVRLADFLIEVAEKQ